MKNIVLFVTLLISIPFTKAWSAVEIVDNALTAIAKQQLTALQAIEKDTNSILTVLQTIQQAIGDPTTQPNEVLATYIQKVNTTMAGTIGLDPKDLQLNNNGQNANQRQGQLNEGVQFKPTNAQVGQNQQHVRQQQGNNHAANAGNQAIQDGAVPTKTYLNQLNTILFSSSQDATAYNQQLATTLCAGQQNGNNNCAINLTTIVNKYGQDGKITAEESRKIFSEIIFLPNDKEQTQTNLSQLNQVRGAMATNSTLNSLGNNAFRVSAFQEIPKTLLIGGHEKCAAAKNGAKLEGDDCANLASIILSSRNLLSKADAEIALQYTMFMTLLAQSYSVAEQAVQQGVTISTSGLPAQPFRVEE